MREYRLGFSHAHNAPSLPAIFRLSVAGLDNNEKPGSVGIKTEAMPISVSNFRHFSTPTEV